MPAKRAPDPLTAYHEKRDFRSTSEPRGRRSAARRKAPRFVIQKHDASTLHYDLRIEASGVLKSWAVPKGPSTDPREKRLAMRTEDHPLDYAEFEGTIPEGEYGGGTVLVWDIGTVRNLKHDTGGREVPIDRQVDDGHVTVWLEGEKLRGGYALNRVRLGRDDGREKWLLVKMRDEAADARRKPVSTQPESVLTGRTLEQIAGESASR